MKLQVIEPEPKQGKAWNLGDDGMAPMVSPSQVDARSRAVMQNAVTLGRELWGMTAAPPTTVYWLEDSQSRGCQVVEEQGSFHLCPDVWLGKVSPDPPNVILLNLTAYQVICADGKAHRFIYLVWLVGAELEKIRRHYWEGGNWPTEQEKRRAGDVLVEQYVAAIKRAAADKAVS